MAGAKGCNDDCAAFIIFIVNSLLLIGTLASLAFIIYIWVMQGDLVKGGQEALSVYVPEVILIAAIIIFVIILAVALLGIITTARQMKQNEEKEKKAKQHYTPEGEQRKRGGKQKGCCWNWGLSFYVFLCVLGFLLLLAVGIVAGAYSDKMSEFSTLDNVRGQGEDWLSMLEDKLETEVLSLADKFPKTWNQTQAVAGCCGWSVIEATTVAAATDAAAAGTTTLAAATGDAAATDAATTGAAATDAAATDAAATSGAATTGAATTADDVLDGGRRVLSDASSVTAFTNSKCCQNANVVTSVDIIGKIQFDYNGCRKDDADQVYTCQGVIASYIQSNLVKIAIISIVLAIAQLTLAVSGCVVRYPETARKCCPFGKKKEGSNSHVEPETEITEITTPTGI